MDKRTQIISVEDIPKTWEYQGYLWYSDQSKPKVLDKEELGNIEFSALPFVIEGNLWCSKEEASFQIKNIEGQYHVVQFDLKGSELDDLLSEHAYVAHDIEGYKEYTVIHAWEEAMDEICQMPVLVPAWTAFKGFSNPKN